MERKWSPDFECSPVFEEMAVGIEELYSGKKVLTWSEGRKK